MCSFLPTMNPGPLIDMPLDQRKRDLQTFTNYYPPILQISSRTLAVPYKEQRHHRSPSESIGNNYSLQACDLKIRNLQKRHGVSLRNAFATSPGTSLLFKTKASPREPLPSISRPLTSKQQQEIMQSLEEQTWSTGTEPTEKDLERYVYYIRNCVHDPMLAPQPPEQTNNIIKLLPPSHRDMERLMEDLLMEVHSDHNFSLRKSIVDYILKDPLERQRLFISNVPRPFPRRVIRRPVPWAAMYDQAWTWQRQHLFTVNPMMVHLQELWLNSFSTLRFVKLDDLFSANLPLLPADFEDLVQRQCQITRDDLANRWLPRCASLFVSYKDLWLPLVPQKDHVAPASAQEFFSCVAALMSLQLRSLVIASLQDLLQFFTLHQDGNDFGDVFEEMRFVQRQVLLVKLNVQEQHIVFQPSLEECWELIHQGFMKIINSAQNLPRVECNLFLDIQGRGLYLRSVRTDELLVTDIINRAKSIFQKNTLGPKQYLNVYTKYSSLLDDTAKQDIVAFLKEKHSLQDFTQKINGFQQMWKEIASLHITVPLSMFCLDALRLNEDLCDRSESLKDRLIVFKVEENRDLNKSICHRYDKIAETVMGTTGNLEELVALYQYLKHTSEVTVHKLKDEICEAADRLSFLLDCATLPQEDVKLNSNVFHWPEQILAMFEMSKGRLASRKVHAEDHLIKRTAEFEQTLLSVGKEVEAFKKKEFVSLEEMKNNVEKLNNLASSLDAAVTEQENINQQETLLEKEQSQFPRLQNLMDIKQPYDQLWTTARNFHNLSEIWMNGPLLHLNAEKISDELATMWNTMYKLIQYFSDLAGPRRVADSFKIKIEKFKQHLPILTIICNPGIKDRHWDKITATVGFKVKLDVGTSLLNMLELGLSKFSDQLEEIGVSAREEYTLEKTMENMKNEWADLRFAFTAYRDTGTSVLSAVNDIQVLLKDHIIKTQTMGGSPFIKAIEADCGEWEDKLLMMRDILESMLKCQACWLNLEPIFSSGDIISKMPEEGRKFAIVDKCWRDIVSEAVKDTRVLVVTGLSNVLSRLQESNVFLEDIQQGLNTYNNV
ncbi:hypothetical protein DPEC_G00360850 [Dallia pectoralis]|uniref:Uncharacterized protein n=1 Tax=Dallia pectoralis TaxID=75939 RepID=A0ACC2F157_DALPE|nr:hypothetical protein DPEC_G00360850 [Dallia pectoralis]